MATIAKQQPGGLLLPLTGRAGYFRKSNVTCEYLPATLLLLGIAGTTPTAPILLQRERCRESVSFLVRGRRIDAVRCICATSY